jgi:large subunit ribosomal protein L31
VVVQLHQRGAVPGSDRVAALMTRGYMFMQAEIHPKYEAVTATCSCGNTIQTRSTRCEDFHIDVCSQCHPFYTGKQKVVDSGGRVDRFNKRFGGRGTKR